MSGELGFGLLNALVLPWWAVWLLAPHSAWATRAASHTAIFLVLCSAYAVLLGCALASGDGQGFGYEGMRAALGSPLGFLAGWTHYLVFDLFVGAWILRESRRLDLEVRPYLIFALMAGPVGLGAFLLRRALRLRSFGQLGASDLA